MLIEFSVENFRSIRERQTLSMVAASKLRKSENTFQPTLSTEKKFPRLLKACVIYGPNASGKSNLLRALSTIDAIANSPPIAEQRFLPVSPFRFDSSLSDEPSVFDLHFIFRGMRYQFELSATSSRIHLERLTSYPKGKPETLFTRTFRDQVDHFAFGKTLEGGSDVHETWRKLTSPRVLFISQAVANSNEELNQLRAPYEWLKNAIYPVLRGMKDLSKSVQEFLRDDETQSEDIAEFLQDVDVPVSRVRSMTVETTAPERILNPPSHSGNRKPKTKTILTHVSALGEAELEFEDESEGTRNLIGFWLPWATREPWDESPRCVLAVDELDSSLHPKIVVALVARHLASDNASQLIFSTHDTHLMDAKLLRRDQFWFTERDANGATQLRCLHEFEGREGEDIEKRYYEGRYRALPITRR